MFTAVYSSSAQLGEVELHRYGALVQDGDFICLTDSIGVTWAGTGAGENINKLAVYLVAESNEIGSVRTQVNLLSGQAVHAQEFSWQVDGSLVTVADSVKYQIELVAFEGTEDSVSARSVHFEFSWMYPFNSPNEFNVVLCEGEPLTVQVPTINGPGMSELWRVPTQAEIEINDNGFTVFEANSDHTGRYAYLALDRCDWVMDSVIYNIKVVPWPTDINVKDYAKGSVLLVCEDQTLSCDIASPELYQFTWLRKSDGTVLSEQRELSAEKLKDEGIVDLVVSPIACLTKTDTLAVSYRKYAPIQSAIGVVEYANCSNVLRVELDGLVTSVELYHKVQQDWEKLPEIGVKTYDLSQYTAGSPVEAVVTTPCGDQVLPVEMELPHLAQLDESTIELPVQIGSTFELPLEVTLFDGVLECIERVEVECAWNPTNAMLAESSLYSIVSHDYSDTLERFKLQLHDPQSAIENAQKLHVPIHCLFGETETIEVQVQVHLYLENGQVVATQDRTISVPVDVWRDAQGKPVLRTQTIHSAVAVPTPVDSYASVSIEINEVVEVQNVSIFTHVGDTHPVEWSQQEHGIDIQIPTLSAGVYRVLVSTNSGFIVAPIVVK